MKLVVLGANGRTGRLVVEAALARNMDVTAVVRAADRAHAFHHQRLRVAIGDPCDPAFLSSVLRRQDAVISTLGGRRPTMAATSVYIRSAEALVDAARKTGLRRVLVTSTALLFPNQTLLGTILRVVVPNVVRSARRMERILASSGLEWTAARPGFLTDGPEASYCAAKDQLPSDGTAVSRRSLARFLVDALGDADTASAAFGVSRGSAETPRTRVAAVSPSPDGT